MTATATKPRRVVLAQTDVKLIAKLNDEKSLVVVTRTRTFPFAPKHLGPDGKEVNETQVRRLVESGAVRAEPQDKLWDTVHFVLTPEGSAAYQAQATDADRKARAKAQGKVNA